MKMIKETFLNLQPVDKLTRTKIDNHAGLYLEQTKTRFSFQLKYKSPSTAKRRFMTLAKFNYGDHFNKKKLDVILKQLVINQGIIASGVDPINKVREEREANKPIQKGKTVNQVFDVFSTSREFNLLADSTKRHYESTYRLYVAEYWGKREVTSIKRCEVKSYLESLKQDTVANGVLMSLQQVQKVAIDMEVIEAPFLFGLKMRPAGTRDKTLTDDEIILLMESTAGWDSLRNIAKMQLLTGCRNGEVAGMRWEEIDIKAKIWTISPERIKTERAYKKMNRPHILPLMPKMSEILLQQRQHGTTGLVFPKQFTMKKASPKKAYYETYSTNNWLKNIGITEGTHQLRRTCATRLSEFSDISELDIKLIINHAISGATKDYIHSQQIDRKRNVLTKWHNYISLLLAAEKQEAV